MSQQKGKQKYNGYVYIIKLWIGVDIIYKIGTTNRTVLTRLGEIAAEMHAKIGYAPKMVIVKQQQTRDNYKIEAELLKETEACRHYLECDAAVCGESELRKMDENELCRVYDACIRKDYPAEIGFKVEL